MRRQKDRKQFFQRLGKVLNIALIILLSIVLVANCYIIAMRSFSEEKMPKFFGYTSAIVISGSMSGYIEVNDMVIIHEEKFYQSGDVITFYSENNVVTHRIIDKTSDGFITKGDANNMQDLEPVNKSEIIGKVVFVIPNLGLFVEYLSTPLGMTCLVIIGALLLLLPSFINKE